METKLISAIDLASELGRRKQTIFKVINRLRIEGQKMSTSDSRGQMVLHITEQDAERVRMELGLPNAVLDGESESLKHDGFLFSNYRVFPRIQTKADCHW